MEPFGAGVANRNAAVIAAAVHNAAGNADVRPWVFLPGKQAGEQEETDDEPPSME